MVYMSPIDLEKLIWAAVFSGLGYLVKSMVDFFFYRKKKKEESISKWQEELRSNLLIVAIQSISSIQDVIVRLFDLMRHARVEGRYNYTTRALFETTGLLLARLATLSPLEVVFMSVDRDKYHKLRLLIHQLQEYFSRQGFLREYQKEIAAYIVKDDRPRVNRSIFPDGVIFGGGTPPPSPAGDFLLQWCEILFHECQERHKEEGKYSLYEKGIKLPRILDPAGNMSGIPFSKTSLQFVEFLYSLYVLNEEILDEQLALYKSN